MNKETTKLLPAYALKRDINDHAQRKGKQIMVYKGFYKVALLSVYLWIKDIYLFFVLSSFSCSQEFLPRSGERTNFN